MEHRYVETLELPALVELLDDLEGKRTPVGWTPDDAVVKSAAERRLLELVRDLTPGEAEAGISCALPVGVQTKEEIVEGEVVDLHRGGVFVATSLRVPLGTHVNLVVRGESDARGLRARGQVRWLAKGTAPGIGVGFTEQPSAAHERRLRRFVMEVLGHRVGS